MATAKQVEDRMQGKPSIHEALGAVMADVGHVAKRDRNQAQKFNFRGIDAVVNAVGPVLRKHGVITIPVVEDVQYRDATTNKGKLTRECMVRIKFEFHGPAGDQIDSVVVAEAMDWGDKATAKAHSVAYRTALLQVLCIPTDEKDPDEDSYERDTTQKPRKPAQDAPQAPPADVVDAGTAKEWLDDLNEIGGDVKNRWMSQFGVPPHEIPKTRQEEAQTFIDDAAKEMPFES